MFGLFKKKSPQEVLQKKYQKLLQEAYDLSTTNRIESDKKNAEAMEILKQMEALDTTKAK